MSGNRLVTVREAFETVQDEVNANPENHLAIVRSLGARWVPYASNDQNRGKFILPNGEVFK